jgi:molecular chaperone GrpE
VNEQDPKETTQTGSKKGPDQIIDRKDVQEYSTGKPVAVSRPPEEEQEIEAEAVDLLTQARQEATENKDRWMRALADLDNFRKRATLERSNYLKYRNEDLLRDLLPIIDNIDRALNFCDQTQKADPLTDGFCMVAQMFRDTLARHDVHEIEALGKPFDPHLHEAIARVPAGDKENNLVVQELEKGFTYHDRLLRASKVVVAMKSETAED